MHISTPGQGQTDRHGQASTATSSPALPAAKQLSWELPLKSSPGRKSGTLSYSLCDYPKATRQDLPWWAVVDVCSNTSQRRSICVVLAAATVFPISAKESGGDVSLPGSLYLTFKHEMAKQDLTEAFQRMQSHRNLDFVGFSPFSVQFLCHNILLTLLGPVMFQHYITAQRANSIRKRHKEPRIISLCSYKISLCGKAKGKDFECPFLPRKHWQTKWCTEAENQRFPMAIQTSQLVKPEQELILSLQQVLKNGWDFWGLRNEVRREESLIKAPWKKQVFPLQKLLDIQPLGTQV